MPTAKRISHSCGFFWPEGLVRAWKGGQRIQGLPTASSDPDRKERLLAWLAKTLGELGLANR
jgi:hypothetical protein